MVVGLGTNCSTSTTRVQAPGTLLKMSGSAEAAGSGSTGDPEKAPPRQRMANLSLGRIRTLLRDNCTDRNVIEKAALFHKLAQEKGAEFDRRPIDWNRGLIVGMMDILELPKTMSKCLALAEVIAQDDDDDDDDDDHPVGVNAEGEHVIEMIDDNEWDDIFNAQARETARSLSLCFLRRPSITRLPLSTADAAAWGTTCARAFRQGVTAQDVEVFKIAMRFIKDDLSNMSTVMLSQQVDGSGSAQPPGSTASQGPHR